MTTSSSSDTESLFAHIGGAATVARIVEAFYDLMDREPEYAPLRAMHGDDLAQTRASLAGFLTAWLGGPRDWFRERPGLCIMSLHRAMPITAATAGQWLDAMHRAIAAGGVAQQEAQAIMTALSRMARHMERSL